MLNIPITIADAAITLQQLGSSMLLEYPLNTKVRGNDYMKAPVEERFDLKNGKAHWKLGAQQGEQSVTGKAFYIPVNAPPEFTGVLARALLKAPGSQATITASWRSKYRGIRQAHCQGHNRQSRANPVPHYWPSFYATDDLGSITNGDTAANRCRAGSRLFQLRSKGAIPQLLEAQQNADNAWSEHLARQVAHVPKGDLVIRNTRLFDPRDLNVTPGMSVLVRGDRIIRVAPDADLKASADAEIIDAHGRFLMPGLWDNHDISATSMARSISLTASQARATWPMTRILSCNASRALIMARVRAACIESRHH